VSGHDIQLTEVTIQEGQKAFPNLSSAQVAMVIAALVRIINAGHRRPYFQTLTAIRYLFTVLSLQPNPVDYATMKKIVLPEVDRHGEGGDGADVAADEASDRRDA
jgi:hypothetical protein